LTMFAQNRLHRKAKMRVLENRAVGPRHRHQLLWIDRLGQQLSNSNWRADDRSTGLCANRRRVGPLKL
jgi:hypothetical protein